MLKSKLAVTAECYQKLLPVQEYQKFSYELWTDEDTIIVHVTEIIDIKEKR